MTLTQLRYLLSVAEYGNFTLAAEKSFVTQPTLSMQIQKLEEELEVKIFNRNTKPIGLTAIGETIVAQAKIILQEAQRMEDAVAQEKGSVSGTFRLGIIPTVMPTLLPMFLTNFIKKYPKVDLKIEEITTENICNLIDKGQLDAGISATPLNREQLLEKPLFYEPFVAYLPKNHHLLKQDHIEVDDLNHNDILVLEDGHCFREHVLNLCASNRSSKQFGLKSGSFETLINLADQGLGMTLLPYLNTQHLNTEAKQQLRNFPEPSPAREISLIHSKNQLKLPIIEALRNIILGIVRGAIKFENIRIIEPRKA
ncbi:MAG: hydrogen peroxide-inducible genes activator [Flavobacteriaceae bacterium]